MCSIFSLAQQTRVVVTGFKCLKMSKFMKAGQFGECRAQRRGVSGETNLQLAARWPLPWLGEARTHLFIPLTARRGSARLSAETAHVSEPLTTLQSESND